MNVTVISLAALAIPILVILGVIFLIALKILKGKSSGGGQQNSVEETQLIQDIHHGLQRMEQRIEALETILLEAERIRKQNDA